MEEQQARQIIRDTFESSFDKSGFTEFIKNLLNRIDDAPFTYQGNYIPDAYKQYIKTLERIGKFSDGENSIDILVITLQKETSLERARTMQRNFIAWYLNGSRGNEMKDAALAAFVSPGKEDWRFSLVKMDYKFEKTKTGKMKVREEFTPARRWSFLVGANEKSHTAQSRLVDILANIDKDPTLEEIENAFDIETVTKEFFLKYRELFMRTKEELDRVIKKDPKVEADFRNKGVDTVNFAKKLMGQIVFLYFLQKKGWFGVGRDDNWDTGSKNFLRELFEKKHSDYRNFYNDILEPLFYEALRIDRSHDDGYYSQFNCKIPFLNGGLFDPIGNYDWVHTDIIIPDKLFSNTKKTKEGDTGDGILDIFDRYNFTVKEDEPLEKEVAIDPELLGKAYEKFNAIRPDNYDEFSKALKSGKTGEENKFNKKFGVYYTPREIVHYMCQQSLINYLATELEGRVSKEDIETLIHTGEQASENEVTALIKEQYIKEGKQKTSGYKLLLPESIRDNASLFDEKLADITVCDPAVGSGAFPVGMMSEIVRARNVLSVFLNDNSRTAYEFKRRCIEHSLYGVDIDPGAVEIAKLRLWLSLVVDEDDIKNIKPLPNLDYRIMQGNSLIELLSPASLVSTIDLKRTELVNKLKKLKDDIFNITTPTQKENKRAEIDALMKELFEYDRDKQIKNLKDDIRAIKSQQRLFENDEDKKKIREIESRIEEIKNIVVPGPTEHFEWNVNYSEIFQEKGGFDVVIANPPYVSYGLRGGQIMTHQEKKFLKQEFSNSAEYKISLYAIFMDKAIQIAKPNGGFQSLIVPDSFLLGRYFSKIRKLILRKNEIHSFMLLPYNVFDATVGFSVVYLFMSNQKIKDFVLTARLAGNNQEISSHDYKEFSYSQNYFSLLKHTRFRLFFDKKTFQLISKIEQDTAELGLIVNFSSGLIGLNGQKSIISKQKKNSKWLDGIISGGEINRYIIKPEGNYILYDKSKIKSGYDCVDYFCGKLFMRQTGDSIICAYDDNNLLALNNVHIGNLIGKDYSLKYVMAIINSKVIRFYYKTISLETGRVMAQTDIETIESLPIRRIGVSNQILLNDKVDKILKITANRSYGDNPTKQAKVKTLEAEIDQLVYKLYDLTPEEIEIVEGKDENAN